MDKVVVVVNQEALIYTEFSIISMGKVFNEELLKQQMERNRDKQFLLNSIEKEIELSHMKIELLNQSNSLTGDQTIQNRINELEQKIEELNTLKSAISDTLNEDFPDSDSIEIIKSKFSYFINNIRTEIENQNIIIKEILKSIEYNDASEMLMIHISVMNPKHINSVIFEKRIFCSF